MLSILLGVLLPVMVLNSISVAGMSMSLLYALSMIRGVFTFWHKVSRGNNIFVYLLFVLLLKSLLYLECDCVEILKLGVSWGFYNVMYSLKKDLKKLFNAFYAVMIVGLLYALYQYVILILGLDQIGLYAVVPVVMWNENLWHMNLIRDGVIRVSSFALEPAYFTIFLAFGLLVNVACYPRKRMLTVVFVIGILMAFSRNGIIFLSAFWVLYLVRDRLNLTVLSIALAVSYALPVLTSLVLDLAKYDVSVVARMAPLKIFFFSDHTSFKQVMFGVIDYSNFISSSYEYGMFWNVFESENLLVDPKSFLSSLLYGYGLLGVAGMYILLLRNFGSCKICMIMLISFNLVSFNVNVLYWPLMWVFYLTLILLRREIDGAGCCNESLSRLRTMST